MMVLRCWVNTLKLVQRQTYTFLSTRNGLWLAFFGFCVIFVSALHFGEVVLEWSMVRYAGNFHASRYYDNIGGKSFESRICLPQPIDMVYTWVNGSDPSLVRNLNRIKKELEAELNKTSAAELLSRRKRGKLINSDRFKWKHKHNCPFPNCVPANRIAVAGVKRGITLHQIKTISALFNTARDIEFWDEDIDVAFIQFDNQESIIKLTNSTFEYKKQVLNISEVFFTSTIKTGHRRLENSFMVYDLLKSNTAKEIKTLIHSKLPDSVISLEVFEKEKLGVVHLASKDFAVRLKALSKVNLTLNNEPLRLFPVTYIWKPVMLTIDNTDQDFSRNRFADNDELRYSLRSVERFVPWIRKIFIVTNGQIPNWLNLEHPRIELVTHNEIFVNKSHLPTFSSPAIETHIHRIPGLSKKFIYMNDDVFFGAPVWPDDFFTHSKGHKIYLSWAVPNCNEGCPASWINDKYCDKACNVSACDYDGGDCIGDKAKKSWQLQSKEASRFVASKLSDHCSGGCALNWVGDRYCDAKCNYAECAFDGGDCGTKNFYLLFSHKLSKDIFKGEGNFIKAPQGTPAMFVNFTNVFDSVVEGSYEDNPSTPVLRNAVLSKKFKVMSITFYKNVTETTIHFQVLGYKGPNKTDKAVAMFKVNVSTIAAPKIATQASHSKNGTMINEEIPKTLYVENSLPKKTNTKVRKVLPYPSNLFNLTLPEELSIRLKHIQEEFTNGELTSSGYNRSLGLVYEAYLKMTSTIGKTGRKLLWLNTVTKQKRFDCLEDPACILSSLPWERGRVGVKAAEMVKRFSTLESYKIHATAVNQRHLLDAYSSSLLHVSRIYNKAFGYKPRKVPAHMPHMVDLDIINAMQERFTPYFDATSAHKLRHPEDMQFAFSFNYYVVGVQDAVNVSQLFDEIDTDKSGILNDRELRTLTAILYPLPISIKEIHTVEGNLKNCSARFNKSEKKNITSAHVKYFDPTMPVVTKQLFVNCHEVWRMMNKSMGKAKYKHEIMGEDDLAFKMIRNNVSMVLHQLDWIRKNRRKFICVNDDLDHDQANSRTVRKILKDFYESFFPLASQFELKPHYQNRFLYKKDLDEWVSKNKLAFDEIHVVVILLIVVLGAFLFRNKVSWLFRTMLRLFYYRGNRPYFNI